jgi:hypothetical protein
MVGEKSKELDVVRLLGFFDTGFHFYFILAHIAALLAIARGREVELLCRSPKTDTETTPQNVVLENGIKGNIGVVGFILAVLYYILFIVAIIFSEYISDEAVGFVFLLFFVLQIVALVCSIMGRDKKKRHRTLATAGVILGVIPWVIFFIIEVLSFNIDYIQKVIR